jgi:hypothetical protein
MGTALLRTRSQQRCYKRLTRRRHRFAKRLRFLLLGLKIINAFGPPVEKLMIALIQECISQIWPEPFVDSIRPEPLSQKQRAIVSLGARSGKGQRI